MVGFHLRIKLAFVNYGWVVEWVSGVGMNVDDFNQKP